MSNNEQQREKISQGKGFIAALDQSGGSTPKALLNYGVEQSAYSNDEEMFACVHDMRSRIIKSPVFNGEKIIGAILFEKTMDDTIDGTPTAEYLWNELGVVPFLKVDKGLMDEKNSVQMMKPFDVNAISKRALQNGIFGTKMRSVINGANPIGIKNIVEQQFEIGKKILNNTLVPIIEPEVNIKSADKAESEDILKSEILKHLDALTDDQKVMLKLTLPEKANLYSDLINHDNVLLVVALSGGYDLDEACKRLSENNGMVASFSRALSNDLNFNQSDDEFNTALKNAIDKIFAASLGNEARTKAA